LPESGLKVKNYL